MEWIEWTVLEEAEVRVGYRTLLRRIYRLPNGDQREFTLTKGGRLVSIVALTLDQQVVLAKQFRVGPGRVLLEIPGGSIDEGETLQQAAGRELLEETGYAGSIEFVTEYLSSAYSTTQRFLFVARNCLKVQEPQNGGSEYCEPVLLELSAFRDHLRAGLLTDMDAGYRALDHLGLL